MKLIVFDCDSTLSKIEGVDELARFRGAKTFAQIEALTHDAMNGSVTIDEIFAHRLELIQPDADACQKVGQLYIDEIEPTAMATVHRLRTEGWEVVIVSGGFTQAIQPLANMLGISRVEAVPLQFDAEGNYAGYDRSAPPTRNGGKPEVIAKLKKEWAPSRVVMVGDGISDLETQSEVDCFIGFGRYADREKVHQQADHFVFSLAEIPELIKTL